jgi:hypothetical protein
MDKHGLPVPIKSDCGISYMESAIGCVHLVWNNNTLYFTYYKNDYHVTIDKVAFKPIFQIGKDIYKELIGNETNRIKMNCRPVEQLFPDYND